MRHGFRMSVGAHPGGVGEVNAAFAAFAEAHALPTEVRRARQIAQLKCRLKVGAANILPRDQTAYIIRCLEENGQIPATADPQ